MERTVLVAEDDRITRWDIREMLLSRGFLVLEASDGEEAVQSIRESHSDLALLDIKMPKCDGLTVAERIVSLDIPLIFLTAYSQIEYVQAATRIGAYGYLVKPVPEGELIAMAELALSIALRVRRLSTAVEALSQRERQRKEVERARDLIAHVEQVSPQVAYAQLRGQSMRERKPLALVARNVIERLGPTLGNHSKGG